MRRYKLKNLHLFFVVISFFLFSCNSREYTIEKNEKLLTYSESKALLTQKEGAPATVAPVVIPKGEQNWTNN
ncbi:MAG: hypothetical protein EBV71_05735, partial [Chitinophagia bacterium]|nr:hypothetical protein [Chitinophagia bacterium]